MKKVLLLLANGFEIYEASVFMDVIGWNGIEGDKNTQLVTCGLTREVRSTFNHTLTVDQLATDIEVAQYDALAIPGGFEEYDFYQDAYHPEFAKIIQDFYHAKKMIASICTGALALGKSGILTGKQATTYNNPVRRNALAKFGANVIHQPVVSEALVVTSFNPATAIDVAFKLLEHLTSKENEQHVRQLMGFV